MRGQFHIIDPDDGNTAYPVDEATICRCTGIKDKNKNLIWETDMIKHYNDPENKEKYDIGCVIWNEDLARFERTSTHENSIFLISRECEYEVISSVFDF